MKRLCLGLRSQAVESVAYCPKIDAQPARDPFSDAGIEIKRFSASVPVWGISAEQRQALVALGGNLVSFEALWALLKDKDVSLIHAHTKNRLGGIALTAARLRRVPLVVTIHGGALDLPETARQHLAKPLQGGVEWGKILGCVFRSRRVLRDADAIITCNQTEATLLRQKFPGQRVVVHAHGLPVSQYQKDCRALARAAFPQIAGKRLLLTVARIDTVKNQRWLVEQAEAIVARHPDAILVFAGACTDAVYGRSIDCEIRRRGLGRHVVLTGALPPEDERLIGLLQEAQVLVLPSLSEPFGLVILESFAAGTPVIASRTSGASELITDHETGWLFDLGDPAGFHATLDSALANPRRLEQMGAAGQSLVGSKYNADVVAKRMKDLYQELIDGRRVRRRHIRPVALATPDRVPAFPLLGHR